MQSAASRMNPSAARHAAMRGRMQLVVPASTSPQLVLLAAARQEFLSNPSLTVRFIAASASQR